MIEKGLTLNVHDHGFVRYLDHMGSDADILSAARVSYKSAGKGEEADKKLLRYLFTHKHTSPFEMCKIKFNIKMPIFVMRQYIRHRMQCVNEVSARYTELPNEFFVPEVLRRQDTKNKQGSVAGKAITLAYPITVWDVDDTCWQSDDPKEMIRSVYRVAYDGYKKLIEAGVAREQARIVLPVGIYTEFISCWDLNNLLKFFALRDDPHAQGEHQDYARAMKTLTRQCFPWVMEIYDSVEFKVQEKIDPNE